MAVVLHFDASRFPARIASRIRALSDRKIRSGLWVSVSRTTRPGLDAFVVFLDGDQSPAYILARHRDGTYHLTGPAGEPLWSGRQAADALALLE